jgi:hypothetical protein
MIIDLRIVQDHGWIQQPDGSLMWGPTKYWMEQQKEDGTWSPINVVNINQTPDPNDPLYESESSGTVLLSFDEANETSDPLNSRHR